jgi:adenine phosphoribosyltransferase
MNIQSLIRTIPDYPKPGIQFRDITTLLKDADGFRSTIDQLVEHYRGRDITKIAGTEARGFLFGAPLAYALGVGFVPVRKQGKLPGKTTGHEDALEYGHDRIEMHDDAIDAGDKVLVIDDLLATGGTAQATVMLVRGLGGTVVECAFVVDLPDLGGRAKLEKMGLTVFTLCEFEGD